MERMQDLLDKSTASKDRCLAMLQLYSDKTLVTFKGKQAHPIRGTLLNIGYSSRISNIRYTSSLLTGRQYNIRTNKTRSSVLMKHAHMQKKDGAHVTAVCVHAQQQLQGAWILSRHWGFVGEIQAIRICTKTGKALDNIQVLISTLRAHESPQQDWHNLD